MKKTYAANTIVMHSDRRRQDRRIAKKRDDPFFRSKLQTVRQKLAGGQSLADIRHDVGVKHNQEWEDLKYCLAASTLNPENIMLEWSVRQQSRYQMAADFLNRSKNANDRDNEAKAIMMMCKIDGDMLELQKLLGLIKPIEDPKTHGTGYDSGDVSNAEIRFNKLIEQRVVRKLELQSETQRADTIDVFPGAEPGGEADQLGPAPLAEDPANRPEQ